MRKFFIYLSNQHENIFKLIVISLSVFLIVWMMPDRISYRFEFDKGATWKYNDLYAPFDFTILKPKDSIENEIKTITRQAALYFKIDRQVEQDVLRNFEIELRSGWNRILPDTLASAKSRSEYEVLQTTGVAIIKELYARGLLKQDLSGYDLHDRELFLADENKISPFYIEQVFDAPGAEDFVQNKVDQVKIEQSNILENVIINILVDNITLDENLVQLFLEEKINNVSSTNGLVQKGDLIVSKNEPVNPVIYQKLISLQKVVETEVKGKIHGWLLFLGRLLVVAICISVLMVFIATLRKDIFADNRKVLLILTLIIFITFLFTQTIKHNFLNIYLVPCCILPIVIRVFFDTRLALFTLVVTVLLLGMVAPNGYDFVFMQIIAGMVTIFSFAHLRKRAQLFVSVSFIFISYVISYLALILIHNGSLDNINTIDLGWLFGNAMLTLFSYPFIYIIEKTFKLTSDVSLMELTDLNTPLLRELSLKAPGTFQHSMQVANLAEAAIYKVGGNALLVRVGALYHDIGKMDMPLYFIENQSSQINPHDELSFDESASIIISHVIRGIEKAKKNNLPDLIIDFIRTHHGTTMVQYFYQSYLKNYPDKIVDEDDFRYPGPLPFSRETAVLMMADSVEASSHSIKNPNAENLNQLVDDIIENQIRQNQFINCDITFKDISSIKKIFKKMLMSFYHVRVEYPH